jgi:hypothetical protein
MKIKIGDIIPFGEYNWRVLDVQSDRALIITEGILPRELKYHSAYNNDCESVTWETCDLRKYLNGKFLSKFDISKIVPTTNSNPDNPQYGTSGGNSTQDMIFLLSLDEADTYFTDGAARTALDSDGEKAWWWLRSPGAYGHCTATVRVGSLLVDGEIIGYTCGVRPALWLKL